MMDRKWWTLGTVGIGLFMLLLDITIVNVALPDIQRQLHASISDLQWVIDAYALTLGALMLTAGSLADLFGRKRLFAIGISIFTLGSALCGAAQSPLFLALARAGQGVGGAIMFATSLAIVANAFRGPERGIAFGVFGAITGVATALGPVIGGAITSGLSWRWIFFVNIPIGVAAFALTLLRVDESRDANASRLDWLGFVTFAPGLGLLVYGLIQANTHAWGSTRVVSSLAATGVLLLLFVVVELLQRRPMFDMSLLKVPTFDGALAAAFAMNGSLFTMLTFLVLYLQNVLNLSPIATGVRLLVLSGAVFLSAGIAGRLTTKVPARLLIGGGFVLVGIGILLMRGISSSSSWTHLVPGFIVAGIGAGFVNTPLASVAVGVVEPSRAGMASGINSTFRQVGLAAGVAAIGSIFAGHIRTQVASSLVGTPAAAHAHQIASAVATGRVGRAIAHAPVGVRGQLAHTSTLAFVHSLNEILLIAGVVAFVGAALSFALIRSVVLVEESAPEGREAWAGAASA